MVWEAESRIGIQMADILTVLSSAELRNKTRASSKLVFAFCQKKKSSRAFLGSSKTYPRFLSFVA